MATNFPTSLDALSNPSGSDDLDNATAALKHSAQHANVNDAVEALQAEVGVTASAVVTSLRYLINRVKETFTRDTANGRIYPLNLGDDFIVGGNSTEWTSGTQLKMFYDRSKSALRGGSISNTGQDDANRGPNSIAWGSSTTRATASDSFAFGVEAQATAASAVAIGGDNPQASATNAVALIGGTASGTNAFSVNGNGTTASGSYAFASGSGCTASGTQAFARGSSGITASRYQQVAFGGSLGQSQHNRFTAAVNTTNATPTVATFDTNAVALTGAATNVLTVPVSKGHKFTLQVIARATNADAHASWEIKGSIVRYSSGNAKFISTPVVTADKEAAASAWDCAVSVNTSNATNNYLAITVTGAAATNIKWALNLETVEFP